MPRTGTTPPDPTVSGWPRINAAVKVLSADNFDVRGSHGRHHQKPVLRVGIRDRLCTCLRRLRPRGPAAHRRRTRPPARHVAPGSRSSSTPASRRFPPPPHPAYPPRPSPRLRRLPDGGSPSLLLRSHFPDPRGGGAPHRIPRPRPRPA